MSIFKVRLRQERFITFRKYYKSPKFALIDLTFAFVSLFSNPYRVCRKFLEKKGEKNIYSYGETPFSTYEKIVKEAKILPSDIWLEMGSGRGKGCFWLAYFVQCQVVGIDWIPKFIYLSRFIKYLFQMKRVSFFQGDISHITTDFATVIYLYGLWPKLEISKKIKVITISEPLEGFKVTHSFWVRFPWGRTRAFVQQKI